MIIICWIVVQVEVSDIIINVGITDCVCVVCENLVYMNLNGCMESVYTCEELT